MKNAETIFDIRIQSIVVDLENNLFELNLSRNNYISTQNLTILKFIEKARPIVQSNWEFQSYILFPIERIEFGKQWTKGHRLQTAFITKRSHWSEWPIHVRRQLISLDSNFKIRWTVACTVDPVYRIVWHSGGSPLEYICPVLVKCFISSGSNSLIECGVQLGLYKNLQLCVSSPPSSILSTDTKKVKSIIESIIFFSVILSIKFTFYGNQLLLLRRSVIVLPLSNNYFLTNNSYYKAVNFNFYGNQLLFSSDKIIIFPRSNYYFPAFNSYFTATKYHFSAIKFLLKCDQFLFFRDHTLL